MEIPDRVKDVFAGTIILGLTGWSLYSWATSSFKSSEAHQKRLDNPSEIKKYVTDSKDQETFYSIAGKFRPEDISNDEYVKKMEKYNPKIKKYNIKCGDTVNILLYERLEKAKRDPKFHRIIIEPCQKGFNAAYEEMEKQKAEFREFLSGKYKNNKDYTNR